MLLQGPPIYAVGCAAKVVQVARASTPEYFQFSILVQVRRRGRCPRRYEKADMMQQQGGGGGGGGRGVLWGGK